MEAYYPLWQRGREENVRELLALGYRCVIKSLNNTLLPRALLGRVLDEDALAEMERCGIDLCGENGEYHTLTVDGPIFHKPVASIPSVIFFNKQEVKHKRPADGCRRGAVCQNCKCQQVCVSSRGKSITVAVCPVQGTKRSRTAAVSRRRVLVLMHGCAPSQGSDATSRSI